MAELEKYVNVDENIYYEVCGSYRSIITKLKECEKYVHSNDLRGDLKVFFENDNILDNIKDTVDIVKIIKPIYNFKACRNRGR